MIYLAYPVATHEAGPRGRGEKMLWELGDVLLIGIVFGGVVSGAGRLDLICDAGRRWKTWLAGRGT
jgi:hypothetical protein